MPSPLHGQPCWFELGTTDIPGAGAFYRTLFGWQVEDAGVPGYDYHIARDGSAMAAGMMVLDGKMQGVPPHWMTYICVDSADETAAAARAAGATILQEPADIPGTGRFAMFRDPQGAHLGILEPAPMDTPPDPEQGAWNPKKPNRANWIELMVPDVDKGFEFYAKLFGWTKGERLEMGQSGPYQMFDHGGSSIGGIMRQGDSPVPVWLPYFGVDRPVSAVMEQVRTRGGALVTDAPMEVPGPAWIAVVRDPQGAHFAVVGAQK